MKWKVLTLVLERFWLQIYYKSENESAPWGKHHHIFFKNCVLYPIHTSEGTFFTKIFDRSLVLTKIQQLQMFSVLVLLEDSKNVWSDHLRQKMANPAAKNRFFHFRHAVPDVTLHWLGRNEQIFINILRELQVSFYHTISRILNVLISLNGQRSFKPMKDMDIFTLKQTYLNVSLVEKKWTDFNQYSERTPP